MRQKSAAVASESTERRPLRGPRVSAEGPAQCASAARKELPGWQPAAIGNLCRGAVGTAAVRCIRSFRRSTPQDLQISLCRPLGQLQVKATSATTTAHASPSPPSSSSSAPLNALKRSSRHRALLQHVPQVVDHKRRHCVVWKRRLLRSSLPHQQPCTVRLGGDAALELKARQITPLRGGPMSQFGELGLRRSSDATTTTRQLSQPYLFVVGVLTGTGGLRHNLLSSAPSTASKASASKGAAGANLPPCSSTSNSTRSCSSAVTRGREAGEVAALGARCLGPRGRRRRNGNAWARRAAALCTMATDPGPAECIVKLGTNEAKKSVRTCVSAFVAGPRVRRPPPAAAAAAGAAAAVVVVAGTILRRRRLLRCFQLQLSVLRRLEVP